MANNATNRNLIQYPYQTGPLMAPAVPRDSARLHSAGTTKLFECGARCITWDGRVFRYGYCGSSLTQMKWSVRNMLPLIAAKAAILDAADKEATVLNLTVGAATYGKNGDGVIAENELRGGYISIYNGTYIRDQRLIEGNTALGATGIAFTIYIDEGLSAAIDASTSCEILANPYAYLSQSNRPYLRHMGVPHVLATTGQYFWLQTWGPLRISNGSAWADADVYLSSDVYFNYEGSICTWKEAHDDATYPTLYQKCGYIIEASQKLDTTPLTSKTDVAPFIMLQVNI